MPETLSTRQFTYVRNSRSLIGEVSELGGAPLSVFSVVSHKTQRRVRFQPTRVEKDAEGDVIAWHYRPIPADVAIVGPLVLTIIND